ncbi:S41 family peptidase [Litorivicinus sp.]|nr:S41 family peptidase [Litorivicinus sp.]MDC1208282.1 S41 family peptidase [Litorivicinus sp.]MDC1239615.1 S41 family peptidase [Litorivicinus sp.]
MKIIKGFLAIAILVASFSTQTQEKRAFPDIDSLNALRAFIEVYERIKKEYVQAIDDQTLLDHAIQGMLAELDPHSAYLKPKDLSQLRDSASGSFGGIGIEMDIVDGLIHVISPIDDSPADIAGIQTRDIITAINGKEVRDITLQNAAELLRGAVGEELTLSILREESGHANKLLVTLERAIIRFTSVRHEMLPNGVGYLRISQFQNRTSVDLIKAITKLQSGSLINGLILDLRNNPGGILSAAISVADAFLSDGLVVSTRGRDNSLDSKYEATEETILNDKPIVVLINGGSASAAEIVAGALQDHNRAVLVGTPSFGKGSVQTILPLQNDYALKLTTARYFTPKGRSIQAKGISPTFFVPKGKETTIPDTRIREADLPKHLKNSSTTEMTEVTETEWFKSDNQLLYAYNLIRGTQILKR